MNHKTLAFCNSGATFDPTPSHSRLENSTQNRDIPDCGHSDNKPI